MPLLLRTLDYPKSNAEENALITEKVQWEKVDSYLNPFRFWHTTWILYRHIHINISSGKQMEKISNVSINENTKNALKIAKRQYKRGSQNTLGTFVTAPTADSRYWFWCLYQVSTMTESFITVWLQTWAASKIHSTNPGLMLGQRRRRWRNSEPAGGVSHICWVSNVSDLATVHESFEPQNGRVTFSVVKPLYTNSNLSTGMCSCPYFCYWKWWIRTVSNQMDCRLVQPASNVSQACLI